MNGIDAEAPQAVPPAPISEDPSLPDPQPEEDPYPAEAVLRPDDPASDAPEPEKADLSPLPEEPDPAPLPPGTDPGRTGPPPSADCIRPGLAWLRTAVPWALAALASFVFAASALTAVKEAEISREKAGAFLLGAVFGGRESVSVIRPGPLRDEAEKEPAEPPSGRAADREPEDEPSAQNPSGTVPEEEREREDDARLSAEQPPPSEPRSPEGGRIPEEEASPAGDDGQPVFLFPSDLRLANETGYLPDPEELLSLPRAVPPLDELRESWGPDAPFVLILHTHGTEAFAECAENDWRSRDPALSVVALGERLAGKLREADIPVIHLTSCFDDPDFNLAYYNAAGAIREALALAPSISYILDIHRDSVTLPDGTVYAPVTDADGVPAARLMFVVGTDEAGADHPGWRDNLALALRLQAALSARYPALMRDVNLRSASFNEQYSKGSLLIEAGAAGCTLEEAMTAVDLLSDALIAEIRGDK